MPKRDGTGPDGKGPQTGRGTGNCSDKPSDKKPLPKDKDQGTGRRDGTGQGQGSGRKDGTGRGQGRNQ